MRNCWLELVDTVLRPARPDLARCEREREPCVAERKLLAEARTRRQSHCEARIERARADVFAADDGVVSSRMTALEREWRQLSRPDPDAGLMNLWARVAPASWIDRKRFRDSAPPDRLDAALALAADPGGVEAAEAAMASLRSALTPWATPFGARIRWRFFERDAEVLAGLLAEPLRAAHERVSARDTCSVVIDRGRRLEQDVHEAAVARLPERPGLARDLAHAALVDHVWRAASLDLPNPVTPLRALWATGYTLTSASDEGVVLELPRLG
jgi:hypothetical protein